VGSNDVLIVVTAATPMDEVVEALPERVVRDLGTAVHRCPLIEVIENPAGRFGLVDIVRGQRATTVAVQWRKYQPSRDGTTEAPRPSSRRFDHDVGDVCKRRT
jgi:hypothetical protein